MMTRRQFLHSAAAVAAMPRVAGAEPPASSKYDLLIKGGRVIDPAQRIDRVADIAVAGGRIVAVQPGIAAAGAADTIEAGGSLVVPGLIDIHAHTRTSAMPPFCLSTGVTSVVDAGSAGADNIDDVVDIARRAPNRVRILLNIARTGILGDGELLDIERADVQAARRAIERHRDIVVGIKARLSKSVAGTSDLDALRRAQAVAMPLNLPVMVHVGDTASPLPAILALLKSGDIVTHIYSPPPHGIFDEAGHVLGEVQAARRRGVLFDIGNGRFGHITWDVAERALRQDVLPDTISSDLTDAGITDRVFDFPTVLSKFLMLGMPLDQVLARCTINAARVFPAFKGLGTLRVGVPADLAVLELRSGDFEFVDNENAKRIGHLKLVAKAVIFGGRRDRQGVAHAHNRLPRRPSDSAGLHRRAAANPLG